MTHNPGPYLSFDPVATDYDSTRVIPPPVCLEIARLCAREAKLKKGGFFLDAGVGTGRFAIPLTGLHPNQVVGVDVSLAMMDQLRAKSAGEPPSLVRSDLQRLPFPDGVFRGALVVHILHLIERWPAVLEELRRVLRPRDGVLLLGIEQGGRSVLVDFYFERAKAQGLLPPVIGAPGLTQPLGYLRNEQARVSRIPTTHLIWNRTALVADTLDVLSRRAYSQMWPIPEEEHLRILAETQEYAWRTYKEPNAVETLTGRFVLYKASWG